MVKSSGKIAYLDGIRGVAALLVFFHHFLLAFYLGYFNPDFAGTHLNKLEVRYGKSVFSVLSNGHFMVCIFFVLSGFVLSRKYFRTNNFEVIVSSAHRRFLRLYIPISATLIISYILLKAGFYYNVQAAPITHSEWWLGALWQFPEPPLVKLWHCLKVETMFFKDSSFDTSLWTMAIELTGSFFVFAFLAFTHNIRNRFVILLVVLYFCKLTEQPLMAAFVLGIGFNYVEPRAAKLNKPLTLFIVLLLLAAGLTFGSYPSTWEIKGTLYDHLPEWIFQYKIWFHVIGAFFVVLAFALSPVLQRIISMKLFRFLGYISFAFYLLHPLVIGSFSCYLFLHIYERWGYNHSALFVFFATIAVCVVVSWLMTRFVDDPGIRFSKYVYERWFKKRPTLVENSESMRDNSK
jgi:peptidoglycan/LPS O-acetylase OafA/YrhL